MNMQTKVPSYEEIEVACKAYPKKWWSLGRQVDAKKDWKEGAKWLRDNYLTQQPEVDWDELIHEIYLKAGLLIQPDGKVISIIKHHLQKKTQQPEVDWEELSELEQGNYINIAIEILQDLKVCSRVWEAWNYNTMTQDDFHNASEDEGIVNETAKSIYESKHNLKKKGFSE